MSGPRRASTLALLALGVAGCSAGRSGANPSEVVAVVDGETITAAEVQSYLDGILDEQALEEPMRGQELDRVKSRLFDDFLDEELLLLEARRRGVEVSESEVGDYLGAAAMEPEGSGRIDPAARDRARRILTIRKLLGAAVGSVEVAPEEVEAYLAERRRELAAGARIVLRSLTLRDAEEAERLRLDIARGRKSFENAAAALGAGSDQARPVEIGLEDLPEEIRGALEGLLPGEVSAPVEYEGRVYLFRVETPARTAGEPELRENARRELLRVKSEEASERLLRELRERTRVEVRARKLPFRYVPESNPPD